MLNKFFSIFLAILILGSGFISICPKEDDHVSDYHLSFQACESHPCEKDSQQHGCESESCEHQACSDEPYSPVFSSKSHSYRFLSHFVQISTITELFEVLQGQSFCYDSVLCISSVLSSHNTVVLRI
ncbi:MAG: hypothetical protein ACLFQB_15360 [Chitinispirillaceae bacterium]